MRAAPSVSVRCSGGLPWRALRVALPTLAATAVAAWLLGHAGLPAAWALAVVPAVAAGCWALTPLMPVALVWDGQRWSADGEAGALDVMIDAGAGLLLRLRPADRRPPRWIAVTAAEAGPSRHALRTAAYAAAGDARGPGAAPDGVHLQP